MTLKVGCEIEEKVANRENTGNQHFSHFSTMFFKAIL